MVYKSCSGTMRPTATAMRTGMSYSPCWRLLELSVLREELFPVREKRKRAEKNLQAEEAYIQAIPSLPSYNALHSLLSPYLPFSRLIFSVQLTPLHLHDD